jgi:branched-chain amino acid transport system substrate-binding protein
MRKVISSLALPFLLLLLLSGCGAKSSPEPIFVGYFAPPNGADRVISEHARQGILIGVEEANRDENLISGRRIAVLHPESPPDDLDAIRNIAVRLILADRVVGLLGGTPLEARRLARAAKDYDVPVLTPVELAPDFADDNLFSVNAGVNAKARELAVFAGTELKLDRVTLIAETRLVSASALADAFQSKFTEDSHRGVDLTFMKSDKEKADKELNEVIENIMHKPPSAVLFIGRTANLSAISASIKPSVPILFLGDEEHLVGTTAMRKDIDNVYWVTVYTPDAATPLNQEFARAYQSRFHEEPDINAALAYDQLHVFLEALRRANSTPDGKALKSLASVDAKFESLTGPLTFDSNRSAQRPLFVMRLQHGRATLVKRVGETK